MRKITENKTLQILIFSLLLINFLSINSNPQNLDETQKAIGISLGYPYLALRYRLGSKNTAELRGVYSPEITVIGLRGYHGFNPKDKFNYYSGFEWNSVSFNTEISTGTGFTAGLFLGGEYFLDVGFSFSFDIGPMYMKLIDKSGISVDGIDWIVNLGLNYYFISKEKKIKIYFNQGVELFKKSLYEEAISEFRKVLKYDPEHKNALTGIKKAKEKLKNKTE